MPYIPQEDRHAINEVVDRLKLANVGELNYAITRIVINFLGFAPSYAIYNAAVGVLECAKMELYRRRITEYEDMKRRHSGDVY